MRDLSFGRVTGRACAAVVLVCGLAAGMLVPGALAQEQRIVTSGRVSIGGGSGAGAISRASVERYAVMLGLDETQLAAALTMHEGYMAQVKEARAELRRGMEEARRAAEEADDRGGLMESINKASSTMRTTSETLERTFMDDLRAILTEAQSERFVRVERARRREVAAREATVSGEAVDLGRVIAVAAPGFAAPELAEAMDSYELELDRLIQARPEPMAMGGGPGGGMPIDIEKMQATMKERSEAGKKIAEANDRHARKIEALLPEEARAAFRREFDRQAFPRVFREPAVMKDVAAAAALDDLTPEQRTQVAEIRDSYERDARVINERWSNAIREQESAGGSGAFAGGGGIVMISSGDEPEALVEARKARRELDEKTKERLESAMSEKQRERLKKAREDRAAKEREAESGGDGELRMETITIQGGGPIQVR